MDVFSLHTLAGDLAAACRARVLGVEIRAVQDLRLQELDRRQER